MRGSLPVHAWSLVLFGGWSAWTALRQRMDVRVRTTTAPRVIEGAPRVVAAPRLTRLRAVDPRTLPN